MLILWGYTNFLLHFFPALSHLVGFFYRTIRMVENGIKPVYVVNCKMYLSVAAVDILPL